MRLIDADELEICNLGIGDYIMFGVEDWEIKNAPTVDAIPREKINKMIEEITKYAQAMDWISGYDVLLLIHKYCDDVQ